LDAKRRSLVCDYALFNVCLLFNVRLMLGRGKKWSVRS